MMKIKLKIMKVSMNGVRRQLLNNYNSLVTKLESNIKDKTWDPTIVIDPKDIERELQSIRSCIVTLCFTYNEGDEDFTSFPEDTEFAVFNTDEEE